VRECALDFQSDELPGYEKATLDLGQAKDGKLAATLIRKQQAEATEQPAVLYLHGFVDYFFQSHLAEAFEEAGIRFYALDLRRYGRSIRPENKENTAASIDEYFEEVDWALASIVSEHKRVLSVLAHSTGALTASLYALRGTHRRHIESLILNSPFFAFNLGPWDMTLSRTVAKIASFAPNFRLPQRVSSTYGRTLHQDFEGEWNYDLSKKPLEGFVLYSGWFRMIHRAQDELSQGLSLSIPVLTLCSKHSERRKGAPTPQDFGQDIVLSVSDIKERSPCVSSDVELIEIEGGVHDLVLSRPEVRQHVLQTMLDFVRKVAKQ
jgi:alpha-beta hydrolase superfamily lysophospholipase